MIDVPHIPISKPIGQGIKDVSHSLVSYCIDELIMNPYSILFYSLCLKRVAQLVYPNLPWGPQTSTYIK